jgi:hypothetical protein
VILRKENLKPGSIVVKIYLYCPETGIYQGEDFADNCSMKKARQGLAPGCTTIAPPPRGSGEVPLFEVVENRWKVIRVPSAAAKSFEESAQASRTTVISSTETGGSS